MSDESRVWDFVVAPPRSAPGVTSMVGYRALEVPPTAHLGMPSSALTLIVSLDDGVEAAASTQALRTARPNPVVLAGLHLRASHVRQRPGQAGVQLAVHPLASRALFGVPSAELSVTDFDGAAVLGPAAGQLPARAAEARRWSDAFAVIAEYLTTAWTRRGAAPVRPEVAHAWHLLECSRGQMPVGAIVDRVGLSQRHLATLFRREVGRTPKTVAMLMRFEHATGRIADAAQRKRPVDLAAIANDTGYCDQAHLTREFTRFAGISPRVWLAEEFQNIQDGGHRPGHSGDHDRFESHRLADPASP